MLVAVAVLALVAVMAFAFFPRGGGGGGGEESPKPTTGATVAASPSPALDQYLAGATGPKADRLAAIMSDGAVKPITRFSGQQIWQIAYSPDGKWLACVAGTWRRSELWLFDASTGDARQATANTPNIVAVDSIAWLSSRDLLMAGYTETPKATGQNADFLVYDTVSEEFTPLTGNGGVALRGVSVSASREGAEVAFVTYTDHKTNSYGMATAIERLQVLDRASGQVAELGRNRADFDVNARSFDEPLISPEGQAIIYRRAGSDVGTGYTVVGVDGTVLMPEKETTMPAGYAWDPGGTKVVFTGQPITSGSGDMPVTFWEFDTEAGGDPRVLAKYDDAAVQDLSWSPDGSTIAWAEYDRKMEWRTGIVYLMPAERRRLDAAGQAGALAGVGAGGRRAAADLAEPLRAHLAARQSRLIIPVRIAYLTTAVTSWRSSLRIALARWLSTVLRLSPSCSAISWLELPLAMSLRISRSRAVSASPGMSTSP